MPRPKLINVGHCLYQIEGTKRFFHSVRLPGKRFPTKRELSATTLTAAREEASIITTRRREARLGVGLDPYDSLVTVGELATAWKSAHCPDRDGKSRTGTSLKTETERLKRLLPFWKHKSAREIIAYEDCPEYHLWRVKHRTRKQFRLGRSVDAELMTLSNLFQWACMNPRKTGMKFNPLATRPKYNNKKLVRHCTEVMPETDEAFHHLINFLFASEQSIALGWQLALEGLTGCRTSEILACRVDAKLPGQPGYMDHNALHIHRLKDGIDPWAMLEAAPVNSAVKHSPLRDCLQAFLNWHEQKCPNNPNFIPGRGKNAVAERNSLTHALKRAGAALGLPLVTSHGLRAYHVAALRSMGHADEEIAARLGHRSTQQVEYTYGKVKPGFRGSWSLDLLPEDSAPAWSRWMPKIAYQKLIVPATKEHNKPKQTTETKADSGQ